MALTGIGNQKTPATLVEIVLDAEGGLPNANQEILLIGHAASSMAASAEYVVRNVDNSADETAAIAELTPIYGAGSEIIKMVQAAIKANAGGSIFPQLKVMPIPSTVTDFGPADQALVNARNTKAEFIVSPYDGQNATLRTKLIDHVTLVSGPSRAENNQFGSQGVVFNRSVTAPSSLNLFDKSQLVACWLRDTGTGDDAPAYSIAEMAAACAGRMAGNGVPFNALDRINVGGVLAPKKASDWISVGGGLESEACLNRGWTPLYVKPNGDVAFVRTVTGRITNGISLAEVTAYYDLQDWQVLWFWRKTIWTRLSQPDFINVKASQQKALDAKSELVRLAQAFQDQQMFQAVDQLAKQFKVERNASDRHRLDIQIPVNIIPALHVKAVQVRAGVQFDSFTV